MVRPSCRDAMLDAAEVLLSEQGAWRLTLDSVAERAQVSKGGLLYHFPSKDALLQALVDRLMEKARARRVERQQAQGPGAEAVLVANVEGALLDEERNPQLCAALVAALANCPNLKAPIQRFNEQRFGELDELDVESDEAALLLLAADGLMLMESLNVTPFSPERREALVAAMLAMARRLAGARV